MKGELPAAEVKPFLFTVAALHRFGELLRKHSAPFSRTFVQCRELISTFHFFKEVARGGEQIRVLLISFIFSFFATFPLSHSGSPISTIHY
jgi:hypothetical protein